MRKLLPRPKLILAVLLLIALVRSSLYGFVLVPPWQAPDEPGHYEYALQLSLYGFQPVSSPTRESLQRMIVSSLNAHHFWQRLGKPMPTPAPQLFIHDPYLTSQREDEPATYYLVPALFFPAAPSMVSQLYIMRAWSIALYLLTILFVYLGLRELNPPDEFVPAIGGGFAALAPMPAFIGSSANNDAAAMASSAAVLWFLLYGSRKGWTGRRLILLFIFLLCASMTKKTTLFLWPTTFATLLMTYRKVLASWLCSHRHVAPAIGLIAVSLTAVAWTWHISGASAWVYPVNHWPVERTDAHSYEGKYSLWVRTPAGEEPTRALQELSYNKARHQRGAELTLSVWFRTATSQPGPGYIVIYDGVTSSRHALVATQEWRSVQVTHRVSNTADRLGVVLANTGAVPLLYDHITLSDRQGTNLLQNGGAETPAHWSEGWLTRSLSISPGLVPHLLEPQSYSLDSFARYIWYIALTYIGFWANFGWLTIPLAPGWYIVPALLCSAAGLGLARVCFIVGPQRCLPPGFAVVLFAITFILLQTFLPMIGSAWQPQGRYLFPALLPIAAFLALGWKFLSHAARAASGGVVLAALSIFDQICMWGYLAPRYWG